MLGSVGWKSARETARRRLASFGCGVGIPAFVTSVMVVAPTVLLMKTRPLRVPAMRKASFAGEIPMVVMAWPVTSTWLTAVMAVPWLAERQTVSDPM